MKVSDVIPERQALLTRDYWKEHNRLANEGQSEEKVQMLLKAQELQDVETSDKSDLSLGGVWASGRVAEIRRFASRNSVQPPAPRINWTYAAIERTDPITLATRLIPFNLGKIVIDHDASADILLEPGDVITIFSEADFVAPLAERSTFVRLEGEVKSAGVYTTRPGDTLRDVVERAGGLTNNAYLFGAQFTRESTRLEQQKKLNAYLDQLERDLDQGTATLAARSVSATQEASARASFEQQRQVVERMRSVPASGRIVLNIGRAASGAGALPPIALENGDRLVVPSQPATVSVMGTVVNPSTFLFNSNAPAGDYLRQAGGPTRFADKSNMFILRADGSVFGASTQNGMFKGHFESLRMFPGDTLMVPSNVTKISKVRSLLDWSQILSGFGIAAAAVNVLK
jgi:protein involved in polysaccharide export with SLBB domain